MSRGLPIVVLENATKRRNRAIVIATIVVAVVGGVGISTIFWLIRYPSPAYGQALGSIRTVCSEVQDFERLFPSSETFISYYDGQAGLPKWNGVIETDIVEIHAQMPVSFDSRRRTAIRCGPMQIVVLRVENVEPMSGGRVRRTYADQKTYSLEQLQDRLKGISDPESRLIELSR